MIRFILGVASSGKTYNVISQIKETLQETNSEVFLLVPEQYSFECEKILLTTLGTALANKVQVVSFTKLCRNILSDIGGISGRIADEQTRLIMMSEALAQVGDELEVYSKYSRDTAFAAKLVKDISELKQAAVTAEQMDSCRGSVSEGLYKKLSDISKVMKAYDGLLGAGFLDPDDIAAVCAKKVAASGWFKGKTVFADGFTGFTGVQYLLLEQAIRSADACVFSFTSDNDRMGDDTDIFKNIKKEIAIIRDIAARYGIAEQQPIILSSSRSAEGIRKVEELLRIKKAPADSTAEEITVCRCARPFDEAEYVAATISKLVRESGKRYKDFIIITGNDAGYERTVESALRRSGIPCFISRNRQLCELPIARFISSALDAISSSFRTENVLRFIKSDLSGIAREAADAIEDYVYIWDIGGKDWAREWDMSPYGLEKSFEDDGQRAARLEELNRTRREVIDPLVRLKYRLCGKTEDVIKALFLFLEDFKVSGKLKEYAEWLEGESDFENARVQSASWDGVITVMDRLASCLSGKELDVSEFTELIKSSFEIQTVGEIPSRTDEVIFGTADRIRPMRPKVVFVMGANSGVFPAGISNSGLFTLGERSELFEAGIPLPDRCLAAAREQNYLFYNAVCSASELVYITFCTQKGEATLKESISVGQICENLNVKRTEYSFLSSPASSLESPAAAFRYVASNWHKKDSNTLTAAAALEDIEGYGAKLSALGSHGNSFNEPISREAARALYGDELYISPSRIENYYSCPFSYFLKNGLKATVVRKASINSLTRGTVAHYILETVIKDFQGRYEQLDKKTAYICAKRATEEYFKDIKVDITTIDAASRMVLENVCEQVSAVIEHIAEDFVNNGFAPESFELSIMSDGEVEPLKLKAESCKVSVIGKVDRVDTFQKDGETYVRIVDYKTGHKEFKLSDILGGRNLQMLIYLCAIIRNKKEPYVNTRPAGILYMPALPSITEESGLKIKKSGFLTDDTSVLSGMDSELEGKYIPIKASSKGFGETTPVASEEEFRLIFDFLCKKTTDMADAVSGGHIRPEPINVGKEDACKYCDFRAVCGREKQEENESSKYNGLNTRQAIEVMKEILGREDE